MHAGKEGSLESALRKLCSDVEAAVHDGCQCIILSDKLDAMTPEAAPIPSLLATGAVHHHLIKTSLRSDTSLVVETAQCFSTHHAAMLIGYGAHAVCPYLAYETARQWRTSSRTQSLIKTGKVCVCMLVGSFATTQQDYAFTPCCILSAQLA